MVNEKTGKLKKLKGNRDERRHVRENIVRLKRNNSPSTVVRYKYTGAHLAPLSLSVMCKHPAHLRFDIW